jgi:hypothetical protein
VTVSHAKDLHMDPAHVYVGAARDDPIINCFSGTTLGPNPADQSFGAEDFVVDTHGHSGYWNKGSTSLNNQAAVIAGLNPTVTSPRSVPDHDGR